VVILLTLLVFVVRRYHARTQLYEDSLKAMSERLTEINRQLEDAKG
jgi:F0F1-type ATP synthase membrane subunit b/b'